MKNSIFSRFAPKEPKFFPLLKSLAECLTESAQILSESLDNHSPKERAEYYKRIKEVERKGDSFNEKIHNQLETTFITPIDREDIHELSSCVDSVIDGINSSSKRVSIYNPKTISEAGKKLSVIIMQESEVILDSMSLLENLPQNAGKLRENCRKLHDLENEADDIYELYITELFESETDAVEIIRIKEVMQALEKTTDIAERVGKCLKSIVVKYV